jgi:magnesium transporter
MEMLPAAQSDAKRLQALLEAGTSLWLDVDSSDPAQHSLLAGLFHFHPLTLEDTLNPHTRVKVEDYDGYLFIVIRVMKLRVPRDGAPPSDPPLDISKICLYVGSTYIVSVHAGRSEIIEDAAARAIPDDPGRAAHAIADIAIDQYFPILDHVDGYIDDLAHTDSRRMRPSDFRETQRMRQLAFRVHRSLIPQQPILAELAHAHTDMLSHDARLYFRDVYDHVTRIIESLDA